MIHHHWWGLSFAAAAAAIGAPGLAQSPAGGEGQRERTGPQAMPPPTPSFAVPADPVLPPIAAPAVPAVGVPEIRISRVNVAADAGVADAVPPRRWRPPADPVSGAALSHRRGEALDAAWVRRQFDAALAAPDGLSVARLVSLVQLINRAYLTAGFINSGVVVGEQRRLGEGHVDLRLVLGRLTADEAGGEAVRIGWGASGNRGLTADYIRRRFPSADRRPLSAIGIERDFRLLAEDPSVRTIDAELQPGARPGEAELHVTVHPERRIDLYVAAANDRSPSVGGERLSAGGYVRNLISGGDLLSVEAGTTEGAEDAQFGYSTPLLTPRLTLSARGSFNDAAIIDRPLVPLDIRARDRSAQAGLIWRLIAEPLIPAAEAGRWSPSQQLSIGLMLAHRRQQSFLLGEPFSFAPGSVNGRSEYSALRLTGDYLVRSVDHVFAAALTATVGLGGTRADDPDIPSPDRNFKSMLVQLNYARRLGAGGLELRARLAGQLTDSILYSGERLSIGGQDSVRGYRESLFLADRGIILSVELAHSFGRLGRRSGTRFDWDAFTLSIFAEGAAFGNAEPPHPAFSWIAATGLSLSWNPLEAIQARVSYGLDLTRVPISGARDLQDRGLHLRITFFPLRLFRS